MLKTFPARATAASYSSLRSPSASASEMSRRCAMRMSLDHPVGVFNLSRKPDVPHGSVVRRKNREQFFQSNRVHRLGQMVIKPGFECALLVLVLTPARQRN